MGCGFWTEWTVICSVLFSPVGHGDSTGRFNQESFSPDLIDHREMENCCVHTSQQRL